MVEAHGLRHGGHILQAEHEGQQHLDNRAVVPLSDRADVFIPGHPFLRHMILGHEGAGPAHRAVGHEGNAFLPLPRHQVILDAPAAEVVEDLVDAAPVSIRHAPEVLHVLHVKVGNAPAADLPLFLQLFHAGDGLAEVGIAPPVQQVEIDPVGPQMGEGTVQARVDAPAVGILGQHLGDEELVLSAISLQGPADQQLGPAVGIHLGRVDQTEAQFEAVPQAGDLALGTAVVLGHLPGPLAETGHVRPVRQA